MPVPAQKIKQLRAIFARYKRQYNVPTHMMIPNDFFRNREALGRIRQPYKDFFQHRQRQANFLKSIRKKRALDSNKKMHDARFHWDAIRQRDIFKTRNSNLLKNPKSRALRYRNVRVNKDIL